MKIDWGTKRTCPSCGQRFYDLGKNPALCPKCRHSFDPTIQRSRRGRGARKPVAAPPPKPEPKKKLEPPKKKGDDIEEFESIGGMGEIEEIEEIEDVDDLEEIEEIEEVEETASADDADDETIIEEMGAKEKILVDDISDEEEDEEEEGDEDKSSKSRKDKKNRKEGVKIHSVPKKGTVSNPVSRKTIKKVAAVKDKGKNKKKKK